MNVDIARTVQYFRDTGPLVQCLINNVVREVTANVLLAAGAAPAMIDHPDEAGEFAAVASGVLVNVGNPTSEQLEGMRVAIASANDHGTPWVLDPVAVGGLQMRTRFATEVVEQAPAAVRANPSEISALAGSGTGGRGVDSTDDVAAAEPAARELVGRTGAVIGVSGPTDLIVSARPRADAITAPDTSEGAGGVRATRVTSGHPLLQTVIGTGCALGALTAAYLGAARAGGLDPHDAVVAAHAHAGAAGTVAGRSAAGPGSFAVAWFDALHALSPVEIAELVVLEES